MISEIIMSSLKTEKNINQDSDKIINRLVYNEMLEIANEAINEEIA